MGNSVGCYRFDDIEGQFIEFYLVNGFVPAASMLSSYGLPTTATIRRRFGLTFNQFLVDIGLPLKKKLNVRKSKDEMIDDLRTLADKLGRTPKTSDLVGLDNVCGKGSYANVFGTWSNALKIAGLDPVWCPLTDDELIEELNRFYQENDRSPTIRDTLKYGGCTFANRFGTWNNALEKAGLPLNDNIYGIKTIGKDGNEYDSISESIVADWLFDNGVTYESHVPYFNKLIADFKVDNYYIEFFGLRTDDYLRKAKLKRRLAVIYGYELIEVYPNDLTKLDEKLGFILNDSREGGNE